KAHEPSSKESRFYKPIDRTYTWMLKWSMERRWVIVIICVIAIISIIPLFKLAGINFLPNEDESQFELSVRAPEGMSLAATQSVLDRMARDIREKLPGVDSTLAVSGFGNEIVNTGSVF